jgi:outer membrane protein assembly factor BamB
MKQGEEHWTKPAAGWLKVNFDGGFLASEGRGDGGVVLRDHHSDFLMGGCRFSLQLRIPRGQSSWHVALR